MTFATNSSASEMPISGGGNLAPELICIPAETIDNLVNAFGYWNGESDEHSYEELLTLSQPYLRHAVEQIRKKLPDVLEQMIPEIEKQVICEVDGIEPDLYSGLFGRDIEEPSRLKKRRGGARVRKGVVLQTDEECAEYAKSVDSLRLLWEYLIEFFDRQGYSSDSQAAVRLTRKFIDLSSAGTEVPKKLIEKAWKREHHKSRGEKISRDIQPLGLALTHAAHELGFGDKYSYETLRKRYAMGKRSLGLRTSELSLQP